MAPQYLHTPNQQQTDTIRVEIHRSFETTSRQWILHPPAAKPLANDQLLQVLPNPFNATTSLRFHLASASPVHLSLYNL